MKYCPTCQTRYDEEILRFCTKDGMPLIEEDKPNFAELPSESGDDNLEAETVIRRNKPIILPTNDFEDDIPGGAAGEVSSPRLIIPTTPSRQESPVRTKTTESYRRQPLPRQTNTTKVIALSILGTLIVLAGAGIVFMLLSNSSDRKENINVNTNPASIDTNLNTNLNTDSSLLSNSDFNLNKNLDANLNNNLDINIALKTPTATPTATPTPTPTPKPSPSETPDENSNINQVNSNISINANTNSLTTNRITPRPTLVATPPLLPPPPPPGATPRQTPKPLPTITPER